MVRTFTFVRDIVIIGAFALGMAQLPVSAANNIVVNGGFETGTFTGWTLGGTTFFTSIEGGDYAHSGNYGMRTGPLGSWGLISQTLPTIPGQKYQLEYWLANFDAGPNAFEVRWGATAVGASFTNTAAFGYTKFVVSELVATAASTTLTFAFQHDPSFFSLDNVSVVAVEATTDVALLAASTPDSRRVDFTYAISGAAIGSFTVSVYRSADEHFDANTDILVASSTVSDTTVGTGSVVADLVIDPERPYIVLVADPANSIEETSKANNTAVFRKLTLGIVSPGFQLVGNLPAVRGVPVWVDEMADALEQRGYHRTVRFNWSAYSNAVLPGQTIAAAELLVSEIHAAIQLMNPRPTDVIDTHWIGHSRGAVVIGQALNIISQDGAMPPPMTGGWIKMTMLDPHPAKNGPSGPWCSFDPESQVAWLLFAGCAEFQAVAQDPDAVFPTRVTQPEVYYQRTLFQDAPLWERFINLWGVSEGLPASRDWTHPGIGHLEIPDAYRISEIETLPVTASVASGPAVETSPAVVLRRESEVEKLFPEYVNNRGLAESLIAKLATARAALDRGNRVAAHGALSAFLAEVSAVRDTQIKSEAADLFIATGNSILSSLR